MKRWNLIVSIFQLTIGIAAIVAYIVVAAAGEPLGKWTVTLILALAFVGLGVIGLFDYIKANRKQ